MLWGYINKLINKNDMLVHFDRPNLKELREEIRAALARVERVNGVRLTLGNIRFSPTSFTVKITGSIDETGRVELRKRETSMPLAVGIDRIPYKEGEDNFYISPHTKETYKLVDVQEDVEGKFIYFLEAEDQILKVPSLDFQQWAIINREVPVSFSDFICWATSDNTPLMARIELQAVDRMTHKLFTDEDTDGVDTFVDAVNTFGVDKDPLSVYHRILRGDFIGATKLVKQ